MILREGWQAVITFIDYSAAVVRHRESDVPGRGPRRGSAKVRRTVQAIFAAATRGCAPQTSRWNNDTFRAIRHRQRTSKTQALQLA